MHISLDSALGRQRRLNQVGETINSIATPAAAYSLRSLTGGDPLAVKVRRSSNDASAEKDFTVSEINSGALLNHINEDVITEQSDFTSGVDSYAKDSFGTVSREASFEGKSDVLKYLFDSAGRFAIKKTSVPLDRTSSYTITFEYYADSAYNGMFWAIELSFADRVSVSNTPAVVSGAWNSVTLNVPNGRTTGTTSLHIRIQDATDETFGVTGVTGSVRFKNIVVTQTTGSGFVTTWYDQSGNGNHVTNTNTGNQPQIVSSGSLLTQGSKACINFDGTDDFLNKATYTQGALSQPNTAFAVAKLDAYTDSNRKIFDGDVNSARNMLQLNTAGNGQFAHFAGTVAATGEDADANRHLFTCLFNETASRLRIDTTQKSTATTGTNTMNGIVIGANHDTAQNFWDGNIQEIIICDSNQTSNFTALETNINSHYSIF